jgi:hypothetical protein
VILRCPIIPGFNDRQEHFRFIGELAEQLSCVQRVDVEPYHPMGKSKSDSLGKPYPLAHLGFPPEEEVRSWMDAIAAGKTVYIVTDGVSSRKESDRDTGLQYLRHNGVQELSAEALLFMMLRNSKHPAFKTISALVK